MDNTFIYRYDKNTKEYLDKSEAKKNPRKEGSYLVPANSTLSPMDLEPQEGKAIVYNNNTDKWVYTSDFRGTKVYSIEDGSETTVDSLGDVKKGYTSVKPTSTQKWDSVANDWVDDLELLRSKMLADLKVTTNYEEPVEYDGVTYYGGWDSAQKLNSKRNYSMESGLTTVQFLNVEDEPVNLTLEEARQVCLKVGEAFELKLYKYKLAKKAINSCTTVKQLKALEV